MVTLASTLFIERLSLHPNREAVMPKGMHAISAFLLIYDLKKTNLSKVSSDLVDVKRLKELSSGYEPTLLNDL